MPSPLTKASWDKYLGDGVLALFLDGAPQIQAERALAAVRAIVAHVDAWNEGQHHPGAFALAGRIRTIAALHQGYVLAGVFDDGRRAEFTVLGPAMNALSRIERRAKEVDADFVASDSALDLLSPSTIETLDLRTLARRQVDDEDELPKLSAVSFAGIPPTPICGLHENGISVTAQGRTVAPTAQV